MSDVIGITGASGFLGSYLAERLPLPQRRLSRQPNQPQRPGVQWIVGDLSNNEDVRRFVQNTPTLIHLACSSYPKGSNRDVVHDVAENLLPTIQLFEAFAKANPGGHLIFSSSGGNMYEGISPESSTEEDEPCPRSGYAIHKLAAEHYLRLFCSLYGIRATVLRISNPYGILLPAKREQGIIGVALKKLLAGESIAIFDSLKSVRDYIHLDDVVDAFEKVLDHPPRSGEYRLFHVSSGIGYSLEEVLQLIETKMHKLLAKEIGSSLPLPSYSVLSYEKMHRELGWKPKISLESGIERMVREFQHSQ
jgi:UDP-glucose 4-epimerase